MWFKKTFDELSREKDNIEKPLSKESFQIAVKRFICFFFGTLIVLVIQALILGPDYDPDIPVPSYALKVSELPEYFSRFLITSLLLASSVFVITLFNPKSFFSISPKSVICNRCHKVKNNDKVIKCDCGGTFESLNLYKWIADNDQNEDKNEYNEA
jgi:hypothetical protein